MPSKSKRATIHDVATGQHAPCFEGLLDAVPDALFGVDPEGVIQFVNRQAESLFGYDRDDLIGLPIETLVPETLRAVHKVQREEHAAAPHARTKGSDLDLRGRRRDGTQLSVDISLSPLEAADAPLVIAAVRDMTHYRRTDEQSRCLDRLLVVVEPSEDAIIGTTPDRGVTESRLAFEAARSMLEASLDSVVSISAEGKITDANEAMVKLTGVPRDTLIGTSFSDYFTDPEKTDQVHQRVFAKGMAVGYHLTLRHHNGRETLTEFLYDASVYRDDEGMVLGVFAAARDVTHEVQAQVRVAEQQAGEWERLAELERFQRLTVGRELKMIELKKEIEHLRQSRHAEPAKSSHAEPGGFTQAERDESGHAEEGNIGEE